MFTIQISGGHGMGKTTLARRLSLLLEADYVPLDPYAFTRVDPKKFDRETQIAFVKWQLEQQLRPRRHSCVFDRGPEDGCAYGILMGMLDRKWCVELLRRRYRPIKIVLMDKVHVERDHPVDPLEVTRVIAELLEELEIPYIRWSWL